MLMSISISVYVLPAETLLACLIRLQKLSGGKNLSNVKIYNATIISQQNQWQGEGREKQSKAAPEKAQPDALAWKVTWRSLLTVDFILQTHLASSHLGALLHPFFLPGMLFHTDLFPIAAHPSGIYLQKSPSTSQTQLNPLSFSFLGIKHCHYNCVFV